MNKLSLVSLTLALGIGFGAFAQIAEADYSGSSFNEVWGVVLDQSFNPRTEVESAEYKVYRDGLLPQYPVNATSVFKNGDSELKRDAIRTTSERFDYYDRLPKKLHPNGVCVAGEWKIETNTPYSGMLASQASGLIIGRISVAMEKTKAGQDRGFGFAGKIFPTLNQNDVVKTGNFFSVDVLMGTDLAHALDAKTTNQPALGFNFSLIGLGLRIASALKAGDKDPGFRPLTQVATAGLADNAPVLQPHWIRFRADAKLKRNNQADFRNEILVAMHENKTLTYYVDVSNTTHDRNTTRGWSTIGRITLNQAITSYGCDRRLHFSHPKVK